MDSSASRKAEDIFAQLLELEESERNVALEAICTDQPEVMAEVRMLLKCLPEAEAFFDQFPSETAGERPPLWQGRRVGAYRITGELGTGGMGAVYRGERDDGEFSLQVAVKFIRGLTAGGQALLRFEREKRILAAMRHPNIAQLLDAGVDDEGAPYILMELVEGTPIEVYCRDRELNIQSRIRLFLQICNAVDFIHRHLIVHSDIKPSNVMVTAEGTAKLLDFGISRVISADAEGQATAPEHRLISLNYASPEQLRGDPTSISTDIYSLGLLLYELLAQRPAFSLSGLSTEQIFRQVLEQDPPPPSHAAPPSTARELAGDLDQVVMKAIRKQPSERYAFVRELAADLENYLSGRPVLAVPPTKRYRLRKWVGRHRAAVASGAVAAMALIIAIAAGVWEMKVAQHERAIAQQRFEDVRKLAHSIIFEFHDGIAKLPGATEVRRLMVARSLDYLDSLAKDARGDAGLQVELASGYMRLGDVLGNVSVANLGDRKGALSSYAKARQVLEQALSLDPNNRVALMRMGAVLVGSKQLLQTDGQWDAAMDMGKKAIAHWERLAKLMPQDSEVQSGLGAAYFRMADTAQLAWDDKIRYYKLTQDTYEKLLLANPADSRLMRQVALVHKYISSEYQGSGQNSNHDLALEHARLAAELDERRAKQEPQNAETQLDLAFSLSVLATVSDNRGDVSTAIASMARSVEIRRALWEADSKNYQARDRLASGLARLGDFYRAQKDWRNALPLLHEAIQHGEALARNSDLWATQDTLAFAHLALAWSNNDFGARDEACAEYARAAPIMRRMIKAGFKSNYRNYSKELLAIDASLSACKNSAQ